VTRVDSAVTVWNRRVLLVFAPILIATGVAGLLFPSSTTLMSSAVPYDVFHIVSGTVGLLIAIAGRPRPIAIFNLSFGAIDLWQAVAGATGLPPAALFALRPADHVVHVVIGLALAAIGSVGLRTRVTGR